LAEIQRGFENHIIYMARKKEDIKALDYETMQAWKRLQSHVIHKS